MHLLPNETIPSFMARTQLLAIHRRADNFYQSILNCNYTQTCGAATYRLKKLSKLLNICSDKIIIEHTIYPYFAHYMTENHARSLYKAICSDIPKALESETGSVNSRLGIPGYHSFCPLCAEDDISNHGVAYWHQTHSLPGVTACYRHKCRLIRSIKKPKILAIPNLNKTEVLEATESEVLFASLSTSLCRDTKPTRNPEKTIEQYKQQLDLAGYLTETGYVRQQKLLADITRFWKDLLTLPDFKNLKTGGSEHNFVRDLLNPETKRTHPVKHILLSGFLRHCKPAEKPAQANRAPLLKTNNKKAGDEQYAVTLLKNGTSLHKAASEAGVSYYTIRKLVQQHSIQRNPRKKKITPEQEAAVLKLLRTGLSMKKAGQQVGLPESTVDNLLVSHPEIRAARHKLKKIQFSEKLSKLRKQVLLIIEQNPEMSRKELTEAFSDVFIWLRNHDKKWLYKQLPKPLSAVQAQSFRYKNQRLLWQKKQQQAIGGLRGFVIMMMANPPSNQRLSPSYILKSLKIRNTQTHIRKTMPIFWRQLIRFAESHEDYQLRKLQALYKAQPALFTIYSPRRLLKIAAAYPPVSDDVLGQARRLQKGHNDYCRPATQYWLLLREVGHYSVQKRYSQPRKNSNSDRLTIALATIKISPAATK